MTSRERERWGNKNAHVLEVGVCVPSTCSIVVTECYAEWNIEFLTTISARKLSSKHQMAVAAACELRSGDSFIIRKVL